MSKLPDTESWHDDMLHAMREAADGLESWEYGGADSREEMEQQNRAALEVAKRIQRMARAYERRHYSQRTVE